MSDDVVDAERRFPRRLLLTGAASAAVVGMAEVFAPPASAAAGTTWRLGGNSGVTSNGSNFLGPINVAPLLFKTRSSTSSPVTERLRITPGGLLGIGTKTPVARLDVHFATGITGEGYGRPRPPRQQLN
jgi:hypothetical protein